MPQDLPNPARRDERKPFELTGRHVLAVFIAFFAVVGGVNAYMMRAALTTMPGLDARNGYDASQRFNGKIADAQAQDARGWKVDATLRAAGQGLSVAVEIAAAGGAPAGDLAVDLRLEHPTNRALDQQVRLAQDAPGSYSALLRGRHSGAWTVLIEARSPRTGELLYASRNRTLIKG